MATVRCASRKTNRCVAFRAKVCGVTQKSIRTKALRWENESFSASHAPFSVSGQDKFAAVRHACYGNFFTSSALNVISVPSQSVTRNNLATKKWDMAAAVARYLVKVDPENPGAWINLAYSVRRAENIGQAEAVLLKARTLHPKDASMAFNLACYASVTGRMKGESPASAGHRS